MTEAPTQRTPLTERQKRVYVFIIDYFITNLHPPGLREIVKHFGWGSTQAADCHVRAMVKKGWLKKGASGQARSLIPTDFYKLLVPKLIGYVMDFEKGGAP